MRLDAQNVKPSGINNTQNQTDPTTKATTERKQDRSETQPKPAGYADKAKDPTTHSQPTI